MSKKILTLNLGTTSTRVAVFEDEKMLSEKKLYHTEEEVKAFRQKELLERRYQMVCDWLKEAGLGMGEIDAIGM